MRNKTVSNLFMIFGCLVGCVDVSSPEPLPDGTNQAHQTGKKTAVDEEFGPEIRDSLERVAKAQSKGLDKATTKVHRAFHFREEATVEKGLKPIAVDVEFANFSADFDLDDVDIIDGTSDENYGSFPTIFLLRSDGVLEIDRSKWDSDPLRLLLVYQVPETTESVKLGYWGKSLTDNPTLIGEGKLVRDHSRKVPGVEFWPYPASHHFGDVLQRGRWLVVELGGAGAAVVDFETWPPVMHHWDCGHVGGLEPAPQDGWIALTSGTIWHHPEERPGASAFRGGAKRADGYLRGVFVIGKTVFAHDERILYQFANDKLKPVDDVGKATGVEGVLGKDYIHGHISLGDGRQFVLWDGHAFELIEGKLRKKWSPGIREPYEFDPLPWGQGGFYYIEDRHVYRMKVESPREPIMVALENVMSLSSGPEGSLLFHLGDNDLGFLSGIWFPNEDSYIALRVGELGGDIDSVGGMYFSKATGRFYFPTWDGIYTVPVKEILARPHERLPNRSK